MHSCELNARAADNRAVCNARVARSWRRPFGVGRRTRNRRSAGWGYRRTSPWCSRRFTRPVMVLALSPQRVSRLSRSYSVALGGHRQDGNSKTPILLRRACSAKRRYATRRVAQSALTRPSGPGSLPASTVIHAAAPGGAGLELGDRTDRATSSQARCRERRSCRARASGPSRRRRALRVRPGGRPSYDL